MRNHYLLPQTSSDKYNLIVLLSKELPSDESANLFVLVELFHSDGDRSWRSPDAKSEVNASRNRLEASWTDQRAEWEFDAEKDLIFIRILVVRNIRLAADETLAIYCVKLENHPQRTFWHHAPRNSLIPPTSHADMRALRLLDTSGKETDGSLLVETISEPL